MGFSACMQTPQALLPGEPASGHLTSLSHCTLDTEVGGVENVEQVGQSPPKKKRYLVSFLGQTFHDFEMMGVVDIFVKTKSGVG